jgi:hypothetical protein
MVDIVPSDRPGSRMKAIIINLTPAQVRDLIGFDSNIDEDELAYGASWGFTVDGVPCGVWYRKFASMPHAAGTKEALEKVFGAAHVHWFG